MASFLELFILLTTLLVLTSAQDGANKAIKCRNFRPEEVPYPTPHISLAARAARCKSLFGQYNSTGTATLAFVGQNTYHNPCKVECALCADGELPDEKEEANVLRSYPPHASLKDSIVKCQDQVEVFEQYMPDGVRCGPFHVCEEHCCTAKPEQYPKSSKRILKELGQADVNRNSQTVPKEWTKPLTCEEEGYYRNPNDCHKFYRCYKTSEKGGFSKTLFECNPSTLVFDEQFRVCVNLDDVESTNVCDGEGSTDY